MDKKTELIVALDCPADDVKALLATLGDSVEWFKVGPVMYLEFPDIIPLLRMEGKKIMLDLKFHDIPNTVEKACYNASRLGVHMLTAHMSGGITMLKAARDGVFNATRDDPKAVGTKILGISVLTSISESVLNDELNIDATVEQRVSDLIDVGAKSGIPGVVCSVHETAALKENYPDITIVNPGIRLPDESKGDQKRVATPQAAYKAGANFIVMGRSIYQSPVPSETVKRVYENMYG